MTETENIMDSSQTDAKELFAYEMTEVMLLMQEELAHFSGKDVLAEMNFDRSKLNIAQVHIPPAEQETIHVEIPEGMQIPEMHVTKSSPVQLQCTLPEPINIPEASAVNVKAERMEIQQNIALPASINIPAVSVSNAETERMAVQLPENISLPNMEKTALDNIVVNVKLPERKEISPVNVSGVETETINVTLPETLTIPVGRLPVLDRVEIHALLPEDTELPSIEITGIKMEKVCVDMPAVITAPQVRFNAVNVENSQVELPHITVMHDIDMKQGTEKAKVQVSVPDIHVISAYQKKEIALAEIQADLPEMPAGMEWNMMPIQTEKYSIKVPEPVNVTQDLRLQAELDSSAMREIHVPDVVTFNVKVPHVERNKDQAVLQGKTLRQSRYLFTVEDI